MTHIDMTKAAAQTVLISIFVLSLMMGPVACSGDDTRVPVAYRTDGTAKLQVCKGVGIEKCDYEPTEIPGLIDLRDPYWSGLRSERKSSTWTMCYLDQPRGIFTKRLLMFDCEPIYDQVPEAGIAQSQILREQIIPSLSNLAEAAATFEVCAFDSDIDAEDSLKWAGHSITLGEIVARVSEDYDDEGLALAYEMVRVKIYESEGFKSEALEYTKNCDAESLLDADRYVRESQDIDWRR